MFAFIYCTLYFVASTEELEILAHMEEMRKKSGGSKLDEPKPTPATKVPLHTILP